MEQTVNENLFRDLAGLIGSVRNPDRAFLTILLATANKTFHVRGSSIILVDPGGETLSFYATAGEEDEAVRDFELKRGEGIVGWVAEHGEPALVADVSNDPRWSSRVADTIGLDTRSIACVPLRAEGVVIGALEIIDRVDGTPLTKKDLSQLTAFAELAQVALNASRGVRQDRDEIAALRKRLGGGTTIIGESPALAKTLAQCRKVADSNVTTLITGESGTGKELIARLIHDHSPRSGNRMVSVNCGALTESLLERELFGHERGAFTGADRKMPGLFEAADGGTIFLDEIGETTPAMQVKLLRVLQEGVFFRLGGQAPIEVDVRVVAATNKNLGALVQDGEFREDLYYRLNVVQLALPPLRERPDDVPLLVDYFLVKIAGRLERPVKNIDPAAVQAMAAYRWPGNIRQLENALERAVIMSEGENIEVGDLPQEVVVDAEKGRDEILLDGVSLKDAQNDFRRRFIAKALKRFGGNQNRTANELGVNRSYLNKLIKDLGIEH